MNIHEGLVLLQTYDYGNKVVEKYRSENIKHLLVYKFIGKTRTQEIYSYEGAIYKKEEELLQAMRRKR